MFIACSFIGSVGATPPERVECPGKSAANYYFPEGVLAENDANSDAFLRGWFAKHLTAMNEPSISCGTSGRIFRFTWLRTFHHPVSVRVTEISGAASLVAIELNGAGGYAPGEKHRRKESTLTNGEFRGLQDSFSKVGFWSLPTTSEQLGMDGAEWIFEVAENGKYHVVTRWSPEAGAIRNIGLQFLKLAKWKYKHREIY